MQAPSKILITLFLGLFAMAQAAIGQDTPIPEKRAVGYANVDFPGNDIRPLFETTVEICERACADNASCLAITYNSNNRSCFLKSQTTDPQEFQGAVSIAYFDIPEVVLAQSRANAAELDFLPTRDLANVKTRLQGLARTNTLQEDYRTRKNVRSALQYWRDQGNVREEFFWSLKLQTLTYAPQGWLRTAELANTLAETDQNNRYSWASWSMDLALAAFLMSDQADLKSQALVRISDLLEARGDGPLTIPTLRLAQSILPQQATADKLDRALGLFGFRVVEHSVDNNSQNPRICLTFSDSLVDAGVTYSDYIRVQSGELPAIAEGRQLFLEGVVHGQRYAFTVRAGLPAANGEVTQKAVDLNVYVRDRDPMVRFTGNGYVLPKSPDATLPLVSVNTDTADLKILKVGDRALVGAIRDDLIGTNLNSYQLDRVANGPGVEVWSGSVLIEPRLNDNVITAVPIGDAIRNLEPGVYSMVAAVPDQAEFGQQEATQWFVVTDLGLETLMGDDGLHVFVHGLTDAAPRAGVTTQLLAMNNDVLGTATTDDTGYARFPAGLIRGKGGASPALVTAITEDEDFSFLNLTKAAFDLSDRGVEGNPPAKPLDVFLTTERGAYRPGETVFATILARDDSASALPALPLTAVVSRADGVEFSRSVLTAGDAGGHALNIALPASAQRGTWTLRIYGDATSAPLASQNFLVEDFVPEKIDFDIALPDQPVSPDVPLTIGVDARYLYGAPGSDLSIEGELRVTPTRSLPGYPGYEFGLSDESFAQGFQTLPSARTDDAGKASLTTPLPETPVGTRPQMLDVTLRLSDGSGRPVERTQDRAVANRTALIGAKPLFDGNLEQGALARFDVIAVGPDGARAQLQDVSWTLSRISRDYQWYRTNGRWQWEPITRTTRVADGSLTLEPDILATVEAAVDWGEYELKLVGLSPEYAATSIRFNAGWWRGNGSTDTPDLLQVGLDKGAYAIGETARLRMEARYEGIALIRVMSNRLIEMQSVAVKEGDNVVDLTVGEDWGSGAYVTATLIRPMDTDTGRNPQRAIGLSYAKIDPGSRQLTTRFDVPAQAEPRRRLDVALKVDGTDPGTPVFATIAAVDVGILNITGFESPDPLDHYFGQHRLGMEIRDLYGQLIDGSLGTRGTLRSGGDGAQSRSTAPPPTQELLAQFSGVLTLGEDGFIRTGFDLPAFNGTVRLMAVVWSDHAIGQAEQDVLVRDPVVVSLSSPRFLAPGDSSRLLIDMTNVDGPDGEARLSLTPQGALDIAPGDREFVATLKQDQRQSYSIPLQAGAVGNGAIAVELTLADGQVLTQTHVISVRDNTPVTSRHHRVQLAGGGTDFEISDDVFADYQPGTGTAILTLGSLARIDAPGVLTQLDRYPYGCTEQVTSKAMPLLYYDQVANALGLDQKDSLTDQINDAITLILTRQSSSGGFGLWSTQSDNLWLDAYVTDFLGRARSVGYAVPDRAFSAALDNLQNRLNYAPDFEEGGQDIAYALMVLAREGQASIGDLRYYADVKAQNFATPMALAQLAAGLAYYGDQRRADAVFVSAERLLLAQSDPVTRLRNDFGSSLRDTAAVLTLASETGSQAINPDDLAARMAADSGRTLSTQEAAWALLAVHSTFDTVSEGALTLDGQPLGPVPVRRFQASDLVDGPITVRNSGAQATDLVLTSLGVPATPMPATSQGYRIERQVYTLDGDPVDLKSVPLNTRLVVVLRITPERDQAGRLMVSDPLPAGFEIDNPHLLRAGDVTSLNWLNLNAQADFVEFRDDRFDAAITWQGAAAFQLGYIVRAVSPGSFQHPAASVEDMYRPELRARTDAGRVQVMPQ